VARLRKGLGKGFRGVAFQWTDYVRFHSVDKRLHLHLANTMIHLDVVVSDVAGTLTRVTRVACQKLRNALISPGRVSEVSGGFTVFGAGLRICRFWGILSF